MKWYFISLFFFLLSLAGAAQGIQINETDDGLLVTENEKNVLFYQKTPKSHKGEYERCHYIHPLWGLNGGILTEDFPDDHLHHRGIFWAWHQIWIDGQRIGDPWEIKEFEQEVVDLNFHNGEDGSGHIETSVHWKSPGWKDAKEPYIKENTIISIHPGTDHYRRIDFRIRLRATVENLNIGGAENEKGYGGFSVRMVLPDNVRFSGPGGNVQPQNTPVRSPGYINISGSLEKQDKTSGILIVDDPQNPGYPQEWILRNKRSMQNAVYPGQEPVSISMEDALELKYSLIIYTGEPSSYTIEKWIQKARQSLSD